MIVLLYAVSGCVAVTALLILAGAMSLETVEEQKKFALLRAIGMSRLQMTGRVLARAAARGLYRPGRRGRVVPFVRWSKTGPCLRKPHPAHGSCRSRSALWRPSGAWWNTGEPRHWAE